MRRRAEMDYYEPPTPTVGGAEAVAAIGGDHESHEFLYVPDLSSRTGWAAHRVPERMDRGDSGERRPMGFRR